MAIISTIKDNSIILKERDEIILIMKETQKGDFIEISLEGNLRNDTRHFFGDELRLLVLLKKDLVIDMQGVTYLSAACSEVLLSIQKNIDDKECGSMCLRNVPAPILKEMQETGLDQLIMIERPED